MECPANSCKNNATCTYEGDGLFTCVCTPGYTGLYCQGDKNECLTGKHKCHKNADCTNTVGSYICSCKVGYSGDGIKQCQVNGGLQFSSILNGKPSTYLETLNQYLRPILQSTTRSTWLKCWHAGTQGFAAKTFHTNCDGKGPTVTIVRVGNFIFGGYTDQPWRSGVSQYVTSTRSFLFSLFNVRGFAPVKMTVFQHSKNAVYERSDYGPTFGGGHDLHIRDQANQHTGSYTNLGHTYNPPSGTIYGKNTAQTFLAGNYNSFLVSDIEVFYERIA